MQFQEDLGRVRRDEVPQDRRWHLPAVYEIEHRRIESWLRRKAREVLAGTRTTLTQALAAAATYSMSVKPIFAVTDQNRDPLLLEKARLGQLEREAPSDAIRYLVTIMTVAAMSLETSIFVAIYFLDPGNFLIIASGVLLAFGGWLSGHGAGNLTGFKDEEGRVIRGYGVLNWGALVGGAIIIIGVGLLRAGGEEEGAAFVVTFTTIVALAIILLEAMRGTLADKYHDRVAKMFLCQVWYATERHLENDRDHLWLHIYETEVRRLKQEETKALSGESDVTVGESDVTLEEQ